MQWLDRKRRVGLRAYLPEMPLQMLLEIFTWQAYIAHHLKPLLVAPSSDGHFEMLSLLHTTTRVLNAVDRWHEVCVCKKSILSSSLRCHSPSDLLGRLTMEEHHDAYVDLRSGCLKMTGHFKQAVACKVATLLDAICGKASSKMQDLGYDINMCNTRQEGMQGLHQLDKGRACKELLRNCKETPSSLTCNRCISESSA